MPTEFGTLVDAVAPPGAFRATVEALIEAKKTAREADTGPPVAVLQTFVEEELARLDRERPDLPAATMPLDRLNAFFRATVQQVWA